MYSSLHMKSLLLCFASWAIVSSIANALPVRFLAWDDQVSARQLGVVSGKDAVVIPELNSLRRSTLLNVNPGEAGLFVRAMDRTSPDGKPVDFKIDKGTSFSKVLVILMPDAKAPSGLRGFAVDDSTNNFDWGDFRLVNATGKPLGLIAGKEKKVLPADWAPVELKGQPSGSLPIEIYLQTAPQRPAYSASWRQDPAIRRLVFLVPSTEVRLGPIGVKVIVENKASATASGS